MVAQLAYDEVAKLLADMDPARLIAFKASPAFQERVDFLLEKNKAAGLSGDEEIEMEHYLIINRLFTMAKIKARKQLSALLAHETENI
jgi:hypothetical protein